MERFRSIKDALANRAGFTLVEVLISVSIVSLAVGVVGTGIFQINLVRRPWAEDAVATRDLRNAGSSFAGDALNAEKAVDGSSVDLACTSAASTVTFSWTDTSDVLQKATYSSSAGVLIREDQDGNKTNIVPSGVVDGTTQFTLCGNLLTVALKVDAEHDTTEEITWRTYLRKVAP